MLKCNACGKFMAATEGVTCPKCKSKSHRAYVNVPEGVKIQSSWHCPECKARTPKTGNLNTPVRGHGTYQTDNDRQSESPNSDAQGSVGEPQGSELAAEIREFRQEMREACQEFKQFRQDMLEIRTILKSCEERLDTLESKVDALEGYNAQVVPEKDSVIKLQTIIKGLQQDINDREQESLLIDIELAGIPEQSEENLLHVVSACTTKLNIHLVERDIVHCSRAGGVVRGEVSGSRPRPIVVRLARRQVRDALLQAARVRRSLTTEGIGLRHPVSRPFFVNERLTKYNRQLFYKVREHAKRLSWRYAWTKEGKIYARREHGTASYRIKVETDLDRVFGKVDVGPKVIVE